MFSNFTTETCTGTGDTLTLTGATTGQIAFSESFADGDLVSYALEDSGGSIKVAGIGTFNSVGTITRNDTWNYNGTVVDKSPATNIALSAGSHTVRCDVVGNSLVGVRNNTDWETFSTQVEYMSPPNVTSGAPTKGRGNNDAPFFPVELTKPAVITQLGIDVSTADAASTNNLAAIYDSHADGRPRNLLFSTSHLDGSVAVNVLETLTTPLELGAGVYWFSTKSDSSTLRTSGVNGNGFISPFGLRRLHVISLLRIAIVGAYPSIAPLTGYTVENNGCALPIYWSA